MKQQDGIFLCVVPTLEIHALHSMDLIYSSNDRSLCVLSFHTMICISKPCQSYMQPKSGTSNSDLADSLQKYLLIGK